MRRILFTSFGRINTGRIVTGNDHEVLVYARNPYGSHNLIVVDRDHGEAFRHGNNASLTYAWNWISRKAYVKAMLFLMAHGVEMVDYEEKPEKPAPVKDPEMVLVKHKKA